MLAAAQAGKSWAPAQQEGSVEPTENVSAAIMDLLRERLGDRVDEYSFPPPVFGTMEAEFLALDLVVGTLSVQFPVLEQHLRPSLPARCKGG